jgi:hypothetical protein
MEDNINLSYAEEYNYWSLLLFLFYESRGIIANMLSAMVHVVYYF